jgi:acetyl-CoA carboxylase carboxyl transferase subunit alpha
MNGLEFEKPLVELEKRIEELRKFTSGEKIDFSEEIRKLEEKAKRLKKEIFGNLTPWHKVQIARHPQRPYLLDYAELIFKDFLELHGDRTFADDKAIVGGLARLDDKPVVLIGQQKGRSTKDNLSRNFGMPHPEGYRKALRLMKLAEKFNKPIITFIDAPGAYPGVGAEERGQAEAIARNLRELSSLKVPIIVTITGEGGSGGALAIGVGDRILMLEHSYYAVCTPEACASILWKDSSKAYEAVKYMHITAEDLLKLGLIDEIVKEPLGGAHRDYKLTASNLKKALKKHASELADIPSRELVEKRYEKFRRMGEFIETGEKGSEP